MLQDTPHFKHGLRLQAQTEERIKRMKQQASALTPSQLAGHTRYSCPLPLQARKPCLHMLSRSSA